MQNVQTVVKPKLAPAIPPNVALLRSVVIGVIGFLTLVDLFATQAILPSLAKLYGAAPAAIGFAVNASTIGMAFSCLGVALISRHLNRRREDRGQRLEAAPYRPL